MRMVTVEARSVESAIGLRDSLSAFDAEVLDGEDGSCSVRVLLADDRQTSGVLSVVQRYVMERDWGGAARIHLDGCCYMLHTG